MESGSLAEWIEGIAETVALIVALFLPIISERRRANRINTKMKKIGLRLAKKALEQKLHQIDIPMTNLSEYKAFKKYIGVVFTFNDSQSLFNILWDVDTDLKYATDEEDLLNKIQKIDQLLAI
ncbi:MULTISPECIES: hypothetical protein [unclassified Enterococcus]|uniref:hypothetical protein n=1 Tax=unclassified Enterococcus TaxID=2608891 RepID=UPI001A9205FE|nr:hypothetical protein [Enterococcus sp. DIV1298c]MBO0462708.1 hypothetical protein [Enterococcus sp. DIV1298c]